MFICIECGERQNDLISPKQTILPCKKCLKKMDKYFEVNNTLLLIDILLLRKEIFRHLIYNRKDLNLKYCSLLYFVSRSVFQLKYFKIRDIPLKYIPMIIVLNQLVELITFYLLFYKNNMKLISNTLILTSFYYLFVYVMIVWGYTEIEYYLLVEFLVVLSNSIGLSCVTENGFEEMFSLLLVLKIGIYVLCNCLII